MTVRVAALARTEADEPLSGEQFARICDLVEGRAGMNFRDARRALLESSLRTRLRQLGVRGLDGYIATLGGTDGGAEFAALINTLTITETQFLRDPAQFALLRHHIFPTLLKDRAEDRERRIRICSAGCASGEEPYSLALCWREMAAAALDSDWKVDIVGIDVNTDMLDLARQRTYSGRSLRNLDTELVTRYFTPAGSCFQLDDAIAGLVRFEHASLLDDGALGSARYDVILCKNVSIYFGPETTRRLVERLHAALTPGGFLLLGHSESLWQMESGLELVEHDGVFCYRKASAAQPSASAILPGVPEPAPDETPHNRYAACLEWVRGADWGRAEREVSSLIASDADFLPARLLMAGIHAHLGRYAEASDCAHEVLGLNSLEPKAHLLLGMIAARGGRSEEAVVALRRALDLDGSLALGYFWLGNLYRDAGNVEAACAEYARAVTRHGQRELDFTEEFAADLSPGQIVDFCRHSLERLRGTW